MAAQQLEEVAGPDAEDQVAEAGLEEEADRGPGRTGVPLGPGPGPGPGWRRWPGPGEPVAR